MTHFLLKILLSSFLPINSIAQEPTVQEQPERQKESVREKVEDAVVDASQQVGAALGGSRDRRSKADYFVIGTYSPFDLLIPSKLGLTLGLIRSADKTWELEYLRGSISVPFVIDDLGGMTDQRLSLIGRSYFGSNSFNFSYGITYFDFSAELGNKYLNSVPNTNISSVDLVELQSLGFNLGVGNRWTIDRNITLGVDWISWSQPVFVTNEKSAFVDYTTDPESKEDVKKALDLISYFPRITVLKLQIGISF